VSDFKIDIALALNNTPTQDQERFIDKLEFFLFNSTERHIQILKGYAGTGKTSIIAAAVKALPKYKWKSVLLAPTGRAAKVMNQYAQKSALTIHKKIYRKALLPEGGIAFVPDENKHKNTLFIVDEASMIQSSSNDGEFKLNLLDDLIHYVYGGDNCKILFVGDIAQLPPVGMTQSLALKADYIAATYGLDVITSVLREVVRQAEASSILVNATQIRVQLMQNEKMYPRLFADGKEVIQCSGMDLEDELYNAYRTYGEDGTIFICRSNKRANLFNQQIRNRVHQNESELGSGDLLMVVKNNYFALEQKDNELVKDDFIANGEIIRVERLYGTKAIYDLRFADADISFLDRPHLPVVRTQLMLDTINLESPSLTSAQQNTFFHTVIEDLGEESNKGIIMKYIKANPYYNALQVKFAYAMTCHKAQGGQWPCVFIDQGYINDDMLGPDYFRWLYTAVTRATEKLYLVNFNEKFFE
jgi:ATP-dependent exoDNAse (exonuclease V) alpha subunit